MIDEGWFATVKGMFGTRQNASLNATGALLGDRREVLPFVMEQGSLDNWPVSDAALRGMVTQAPGANRMHDGIVTGSRYPDPGRDELYSKMLLLIEAASPARETWFDNKPGIIDDLRVAVGIERRKSIKHFRPSAFIDCENRKATTVIRPDAGANPIVANLSRILLNQPAWWGIMPRKFRIRKLRKRAEQRGLFDGAAYLKRYPDVAASGMDPLQHYLYFGYEEGRTVIA